MKKAFAIIFDDINSEIEMTDFVEVIRSSYISKRAKENMFIIIEDKNEEAKKIFEQIQSKVKFKPSFLVIEMDDFYGLFWDEAGVWLKQQLPGFNWAE